MFSLFFFSFFSDAKIKEKKKQKEKEKRKFKYKIKYASINVLTKKPHENGASCVKQAS